VAVTLTPKRAVLLVAGVFLGLGAVQTYAAVAVPESDQLAVIRWSAVGMLLLLGLVVMLLRGMIRVESGGEDGSPGENADSEGVHDAPDRTSPPGPGDRREAGDGGPGET
jgi:Zn-dependent alcohol dehydrogenase